MVTKPEEGSKISYGMKRVNISPIPRKQKIPFTQIAFLSKEAFWAVFGVVRNDAKRALRYKIRKQDVTYKQLVTQCIGVVFVSQLLLKKKKAAARWLKNDAMSDCCEQVDSDFLRTLSYFM